MADEKEEIADVYAAERKRRRSSILKTDKARNVLTDVATETISKRRVSFSSTNYIKPFATDTENVTIWDTTYEENIKHTDSNGKDSNELIASDTCVNATQSMEMTCEMNTDVDSTGLSKGWSLLSYIKKNHQIIGNTTVIDNSNMDLTQVGQPSSDDMEFTCQLNGAGIFKVPSEPYFTAPIKKSTTCDSIQIAESNRTVHNIDLSNNSIMSSDLEVERSPIDMEITCGPSEYQKWCSFGHAITQSSETSNMDMSLTCVSKGGFSYPTGESRKEDSIPPTVVDMELTFFPQELSKTDDPPVVNVLEFTGANKENMFNHDIVTCKPTELQTHTPPAVNIFESLAANKENMFNHGIITCKPSELQTHNPPAVNIFESTAANKEDMFNHDIVTCKSTELQTHNPPAVNIFESTAANKEDMFNHDIVTCKPTELQTHTPPAVNIFESLAANKENMFNHGIITCKPSELQTHNPPAVNIFESTAANKEDMFNHDIVTCKSTELQTHNPPAVNIFESTAANKENMFNHDIVTCKPSELQTHTPPAVNIFESTAANKENMFNHDIVTCEPSEVRVADISSHKVAECSDMMTSTFVTDKTLSGLPITTKQKSFFVFSDEHIEIQKKTPITVRSNETVTTSGSRVTEDISNTHSLVIDVVPPSCEQLDTQSLFRSRSINHSNTMEICDDSVFINKSNSNQSQIPLPLNESTMKDDDRNKFAKEDSAKCRNEETYLIQHEASSHIHSKTEIKSNKILNKTYTSDNLNRIHFTPTKECVMVTDGISYDIVTEQIVNPTGPQDLCIEDESVVDLVDVSDDNIEFCMLTTSKVPMGGFLSELSERQCGIVEELPQQKESRTPISLSSIELRRNLKKNRVLSSVPSVKEALDNLELGPIEIETNNISPVDALASFGITLPLPSPITLDTSQLLKDIQQNKEKGIKREKELEIATEQITDKLQAIVDHKIEQFTIARRKLEEDKRRVNEKIAAIQMPQNPPMRLKSYHEKILELAEKQFKTHWSLLKWEENSYTFQTFFDSVEFHVDICPDRGLVKKFNVETKMREDISPVAKYFTSVLVSRLNPTTLSSFLGAQYDILTVLDYVCFKMEEMAQINNNWDQLVIVHKHLGLTMNSDFSVQFTILDLDCTLKWKIMVQMPVHNFVLTEDSVSVEKCKYGPAPDEKIIKSFAQNTESNLEFLNHFIKSVLKYKKSVARAIPKNVLKVPKLFQHFYK